MEVVVSKTQRVNVRKALDDIYGDVSWLRISRTYFDKSASWIYNKFRGIDGNGKEADFTEEERLLLKGALNDLADRIRKASDKI